MRDLTFEKKLMDISVFDFSSSFLIITKWMYKASCSFIWKLSYENWACSRVGRSVIREDVAYHRFGVENKTLTLALELRIKRGTNERRRVGIAKDRFQKKVLKERNKENIARRPCNINPHIWQWMRDSFFRDEHGNWSDRDMVLQNDSKNSMFCPWCSWKKF